MRCLLTAKLDTETGNRLITSGRMAQAVEQIVGDIKPEAVYFVPISGRRTILMIVDVADASELVSKLEPLWIAAGAEVDITPVMVREDLERGFQALAPNLAKYAP